MKATNCVEIVFKSVRLEAYAMSSNLEIGQALPESQRSQIRTFPCKNIHVCKNIYLLYFIKSIL